MQTMYNPIGNNQKLLRFGQGPGIQPETPGFSIEDPPRDVVHIAQARPKAGPWDWFIRGAVALTMLFSAATAVTAIKINQEVNSVVERVPSQQEIDDLLARIPSEQEIQDIQDKINERLDALPSNTEIEEIITALQEFESLRDQLNSFSQDDINNATDTINQMQQLLNRLKLLGLIAD